MLNLLLQLLYLLFVLMLHEYNMITERKWLFCLSCVFYCVIGKWWLNRDPWKTWIVTPDMAEDIMKVLTRQGWVNNMKTVIGGNYASNYFSITVCIFGLHSSGQSENTVKTIWADQGRWNRKGKLNMINWAKMTRHNFCFHFQYVKWWSKNNMIASNIPIYLNLALT